MKRGAYAALCVCVALCSLASCSGRPRSTAGAGTANSSEPSHPDWKGKLVEFDLGGGAPESSDGGLFPRAASRTYVGLVRAIQRAKKDEDATGFFVRLGTASLGWAHTEELSGLLAELRATTKKPVVCHAHSLGNSSTWLLLASCDRVWLSPAGDVDSVGIAGQVVYLKGALDRLKVHADFLHMGKYKSAAESLTQEGPSDAAREALTETFGSMRATWLDGASKARPVAELRHDLEAGPWGAEDARRHGLIDEVGYESDARADAEQRAMASKTSVFFGSKASTGPAFDLPELVRVLSGADERSSGRPQVVVLPAVGAIAMSGGGFLDSGGITAKALTKTIRRLAKDDSAKAVVLRIDSPGGSALASDLLWHELSELARKKPLIASVGDMAASGGYYLAVAADTIIAESTSIVGSIGVVGGKIAIGDALHEIGINAVTFPASPEPGAAARAAYLSPFADWDDPTRERVRAQMSSIYDLFLDRVAKGRKQPIDEIKKVAEGRIWSGAQGKEHHLVDEIGGLARAIELARQRGGVDVDAPVRVEGGSESLLDLLSLDDDASESAARAAAERLFARRARLAELVPVELWPTVASVQPLASGERVLCALPFVVVSDGS